MNGSGSHFDEMEHLLYLEGQLEPARARELSAHTDKCAECRALLRALEGEERHLRAALLEADEAIPARLLEPPARPQISWGWLIGFGFGTAGIYTLWTGIFEPSMQQFSQAGFSQGNILTMMFFSGAFWKGWDSMRTLVEFLATGTLAIVVLALLRRHWRRFTSVAVVMGALAFVLSMPSPLAAADIHHGDPNYTLPAGSEVKSDLIVYANFTHIDGDVDGDLIAWSQSVIVNGRVKGDIIAFARELRVYGPVDGNIRSFVQTLNLENTVGRNVMCWCGNVELPEKSQISGSLTVGSGDVQLTGRVGRDLLAFAGELEMNGFIGGSARITAGDVRIGSNAEIDGPIRVRSDHHPDVSPAAKLASPIEFVERRHRTNYSSPRYYWHQALIWGAAFVFGLAVVLLLPSFFSSAVGASNRFGPALSVGALILVVTPVAAVIACATIVGLGVGIATFFLYIVALYASQVFVGAWIGEKLLGEGTGTGALLGRLALGLAIFRVLRMIPYIGGLVMLLALIWGLGAVGLAVYKSTRPQVAAA
jgi:cytoskeletal protein CcmA (bactofilin family)